MSIELTHFIFGYMKISVLLVLFLILSSNCHLLPEDACAFSIQALNGIKKILKFYENHVSQIDFDGLFGFQLLQDHLQGLTDQSINSICNEEQYGLFAEIKRLKDICMKVNRVARIYVKQKFPNYYNEIKPLTRSFRSIPSIWKSFSLTNKYAMTVDLNSKVDYNEEIGDACMKEITRNCSISDKCYSEFVDSPIGKEYVATHQILYLSLYHKNKCYLTNAKKINKKLLETKIEDVCRHVLKETEDTFKTDDVNLQTSLDIILERIVVCGGKLGYLDFFTPRTFLLILMSQHPKNGCIGQDNVTSNLFKRSNKLKISLKRVKRRSSLMGEGCSSHTLGLGAAAYGAFLKRFLISNQENKRK